MARLKGNYDAFLFEMRTLAPMDSRTKVDSLKDLFDADWWNGAALFEGLQVVYKDENLYHIAIMHELTGDETLPDGHLSYTDSETEGKTESFSYKNEGLVADQVFYWMPVKGGGSDSDGECIYVPSEKIGDTVTSEEHGGLAATTRKTLLENEWTFSELMDEILFPTKWPTIVFPSLSTSVASSRATLYYGQTIANPVAGTDVTINNGSCSFDTKINMNNFIGDINTTTDESGKKIIDWTGDKVWDASPDKFFMDGDNKCINAESNGNAATFIINWALGSFIYNTRDEKLDPRNNASTLYTKYNNVVLHCAEEDKGEYICLYASESDDTITGYAKYDTDTNAYKLYNTSFTIPTSIEAAIVGYPRIKSGSASATVNLSAALPGYPTITLPSITASVTARSVTAGTLPTITIENYGLYFTFNHGSAEYNIYKDYGDIDFDNSTFVWWDAKGNEISKADADQEIYIVCTSLAWTGSASILVDENGLQANNNNIALWKNKWGISDEEVEKRIEFKEDGYYYPRAYEVPLNPVVKKRVGVTSAGKFTVTLPALNGKNLETSANNRQSTIYYYAPGVALPNIPSTINSYKIDGLLSSDDIKAYTDTVYTNSSKTESVNLISTINSMFTKYGWTNNSESNTLTYHDFCDQLSSVKGTAKPVYTQWKFGWYSDVGDATDATSIGYDSTIYLGVKVDYAKADASELKVGTTDVNVNNYSNIANNSYLTTVTDSTTNVTNLRFVEGTTGMVYFPIKALSVSGMNVNTPSLSSSWNTKLFVGEKIKFTPTNIIKDYVTLTKYSGSITGGLTNYSWTEPNDNALSVLYSTDNGKNFIILPTAGQELTISSKLKFKISGTFTGGSVIKDSYDNVVTNSSTKFTDVAKYVNTSGDLQNQENISTTIAVEVIDSIPTLTFTNWSGGDDVNLDRQELGTTAEAQTNPIAASLSGLGAEFYYSEDGSTFNKLYFGYTKKYGQNDDQDEDQYKITITEDNQIIKYSSKHIYTDADKTNEISPINGAITLSNIYLKRTDSSTTHTGYIQYSGEDGTGYKDYYYPNDNYSSIATICSGLNVDLQSKIVWTSWGYKYIVTYMPIDGETIKFANDSYKLTANTYATMENLAASADGDLTMAADNSVPCHYMILFLSTSYTPTDVGLSFYLFSQDNFAWLSRGAEIISDFTQTVNNKVGEYKNNITVYDENNKKLGTFRAYIRGYDEGLQFDAEDTRLRGRYKN